MQFTTSRQRSEMWAVLFLLAPLTVVYTFTWSSFPRTRTGRQISCSEPSVHSHSRRERFRLQVTQTTTTTSTSTVDDLFASITHEFNVQLPRDNKKSSLLFLLNQLAAKDARNAGPRADALLRTLVDNTTVQAQEKNTDTATAGLKSTNSKEENDDVMLTAVVLNKALACYKTSLSRAVSRTKQQILAQKAEELLMQWRQWYSKQLVQDNADTVSYNTLIDLLGKSNQCTKAEHVFESMMSQPDVITYSSLLHAHAVAGNSERARQLLEDMLQTGPSPTIHCYNNVLYAYSKDRKPTAAEDFLRWWKTQANANAKNRKDKSNKDNDSATEDDANYAHAVKLHPGTQSYNIVLHAMAQRMDRYRLARAEKLFQRMPRRDAISYTTLVAACCRLKSKNGGLALETIDRILDQAAHEIVLDAPFVSNVVFSLATNPAFAEFAQDWVDELEEQLKPDLQVYNALIYCWAESHSPRAVPQVLELLTHAEEYGLHPTVETYTSVLHALKSRGTEALAAAETILARMEQIGPAPNVQSYTALIQNYARSKLPFKAKKAWDVLQRMTKTTKTQPNIITFNAVLNSCEYTDPKDRYATEEALKVALLTFDEIRDNPRIQPSHVTYGSFLGVLARLMPSETRQEIVELVFKRCAKEGQVSRYVLKKVQEAADAERYERILEGHAEQALPKVWTSHVQEGKARIMN